MADSPYSIWIKTLVDRIGSAIRESTGASPSPAEIENTIGMREGIADIFSSIAFRVAKQTGKPPDDMAAGIAKELAGMPGVESASHEKGFVNLKLSREAFARDVIRHILSNKEACMSSGTGSGKSVIVEYISANPVHPLHVGQLRNALIGDFVSNVHEMCAYKVERENYIDDLGLQAAQAAWGYINIAHGVEKGEEKFDHWLGGVYVEVNSRMEEEGVKEGIASTLKQMEEHNSETARIARTVSEKCVVAQQQTQSDYGIFLDVLVWEGDIVRERLLEKALGILSKNLMFGTPTEGKYANCFVLDLDKVKDLPEEFKGMKDKIKVLKRSDGTATYAAKDIAFHMWKFGLLPNVFSYREFLIQANGKPLYTTADAGEKMNFGAVDLAVNVIDARQSYEQSVVRIALDAIGRGDLARSLKHLSYGVVDLEGARLAGRKGTWVGNTADDLLKGTESKAAELITARMKLTDEQKARIAKSIALAAIKFEFLRVSPEKNIVFSWDRALNFESNSGPYFQYMHARASRILGDYKREVDAGKVDYAKLAGDQEFALVKKLSIAQGIVEKACREYRPNVLTDYISDLSSQFSKFYENVPILKAGNDDEKDARVALTASFRYTIAALLRALGIEPADMM